MTISHVPPPPCQKIRLPVQATLCSHSNHIALLQCINSRYYASSSISEKLEDFLYCVAVPTTYSRWLSLEKEKTQPIILFSENLLDTKTTVHAISSGITMNPAVRLRSQGKCLCIAPTVGSNPSQDSMQSMSKYGRGHKDTKSHIWRRFPLRKAWFHNLYIAHPPICPFLSWVAA